MRIGQAVAAKSERDRVAETKDKTGVFTGAYAINPVNDEKIPVWIADYVLMGYGTGAIMAVPAHDQRDYDFATKFKLPIRTVVKPADGSQPPAGRAFEGDGIAINSLSIERADHRRGEGADHSYSGRPRESGSVR